MNVLLLSGDPAALDPRSDTRRRLLAYAGVVDELHVVVVSPSGSFSREGNLILHPAASRFRILRLFKALLLARRLAGPELVSSQDPFFLGLVALFSSRGRPLELQIHTDFLSPAFARLSLANRLRVFLARRLIPRASSLRVVSERIRRSLAREGYGAIPVSVLPVFVDRAAFSGAPRAPLPGRFGKSVLMVSRLAPEKDFRTALEAIALLARRIPDAGLVIAGDGPERGMIERTIPKLGLSGRVVLARPREVAGWYRSADAFLLSSRYEGYGRTLVEAAAARTPIVTTDVGIAGFELGRDEAVICPVGDAACLAEGLARVLEDPGAAASMAERARRGLDSLPATAREHAELFRAALARCLAGRSV